MRGGQRLLGALGAALALTGGAQAEAAGRCGDVAERPWCATTLDPDVRAELLLAALTPQERIGLLSGDGTDGHGRDHTHTGTSSGVPRLGVPTLQFTDGPAGVRQGRATSLPSPMSLAATFSPELAAVHAGIVGDEARKKGNDIVFAPAVNLLRTARNGRTFEYFGEDPYLSGVLAAGWTRGVQAQGVIGNVKHFAVNNQEGEGAPDSAPGAQVGARGSVDARVSERALRELYTPAFEQAVRAGVGTVMCAYPRVNGTFACENPHLLTDILRRDFGFRGVVLSDYGAAKSTDGSLRAGLDLDVFPGRVLGPELVNAALLTGSTTQASIDAHAGRILRTMFAFGLFDRDPFPDDDGLIDLPGHDAAAGALAEEGTVLLRNEGGLLPLDARRERTVAVIGPEADRLVGGGGSSEVTAFRSTTALDGLRARLGAGRVRYDDGSDGLRAARMAAAADVAIVVVGDRSGEGVDKPGLGLNDGQTDGVDRDALIGAVAGAQPRTVVVLQTGGPVLTPWRTRVPAVLEAWFGGQNRGTALARVLFGAAEPGGRLPATFPVRGADEPVAGDREAYPGVGEVAQYKEDVLIGYRWYDAKRLDVAYPFGHGLSYTSFRFSGLRREAEGVSATVENTGRRAGTTVPQLYLGLPQPGPGVVQPPFQLKGMSRISLRPGERRRIAFPFDERAFSFYDERAAGWRVADGCAVVAVGASSRDLPLRGKIGRGATCPGELPGPVACTRRSSVTITVPRGYRRAVVRVGGKRVRLRSEGGRLQARIVLRGRGAGRLSVRITGRSRAGRTRSQVRVLRVCAAR